MFVKSLFVSRYDFLASLEFVGKILNVFPCEEFASFSEESVKQFCGAQGVICGQNCHTGLSTNKVSNFTRLAGVKAYLSHLPGH